jgi:hypothetical protein
VSRVIDGRGNDALWKPWKAKRQAFHRSHERLEIAKAAISTFPPPRLRSLSPDKTKNKGPIWGRWKSGNPKSGFPLSHRPDLPAAQGKKSGLIVGKNG